MAAKPGKTQPVRSYSTLKLQVKDHIATITLNRPDRLNAFDPQMMREIVAALDRVDADDAVRAVIVTGAGRAFCSGLDLKDHGVLPGIELLRALCTLEGSAPGRSPRPAETCAADW